MVKKQNAATGDPRDKVLEYAAERLEMTKVALCVAADLTQQELVALGIAYDDLVAEVKEMFSEGSKRVTFVDPTRPGRRPTWTTEKIAEVAAFRSAGQSTAEIAAAYGLSTARVYQLLRQYESTASNSESALESDNEAQGSDAIQLEHLEQLSAPRLRH